jgi:hypothetical protein
VIGSLVNAIFQQECFINVFWSLAEIQRQEGRFANRPYPQSGDQWQMPEKHRRLLMGGSRTAPTCSQMTNCKCQKNTGDY